MTPWTAPRALPHARGHRMWPLLAAILLPACGGDLGDPEAGTPVPPERPPACRDLSLGDPRTGGRFACTACVRHWRWRLPEPGDRFTLLGDLACDDAADARLVLQDPLGSTIWVHAVHPGDHGLICESHAPAPPGIYTLVLAGEVPGGFTRFSGSLWLNAFDAWGERLAPFHGPLP